MKAGSGFLKAFCTGYTTASCYTVSQIPAAFTIVNKREYFGLHFSLYCIVWIIDVVQNIAVSSMIKLLTAGIYYLIGLSITAID